MRKLTLLFCSLFVLLIALQSCNQAAPEAETWESEWLGQTKQEVIDNAEEQFQGFSRTMMEVTYRYKELYWAGQDQNWEYAEYQREHIEEALEQGFVRRPERELSSRQFMNIVLPDMEEAIKSQSPERFMESFTQLTNTCNTCHQMEEVAFMKVATPENRNTIIKF